MSDDDLLAAAFEEHRGHLRAVAYRLLGSMTDADDAVQDTWLRLTSTDVSEVANLGGWLTTVTGRLALNMLRARRSRPEEPAGEEWPPGTGEVGPEDEAVLADSVGLALLVVLDTLTPAERLAFVLHDMFALPFTDVAAVLGRSPEAARQLASRARRRVRGAPAPETDLARQREAAAAYLAAARGGDFAGLVAVLDENVVLTTDAAASPSGRPAVLRGARAVARGAVSSARLAAGSRLALVDGGVGVVYAPGGRLRVALTFALAPSGAISAIEVIADPPRLRGLRLAVLEEGQGRV
jgi:RNA polymerase sigma factor (sigma-70 family)